MWCHDLNLTWMAQGTGRRLAAAFAWLVVVLVSGLLLTPALQADVKVGDPFPALAPAALVPLSGNGIPETAGRVVLADFWASWCSPCKASFAMLAQFQKEFGARGLVIAAIGIDEKPAAAAAFAKRLAPSFPTLHDREQKLVQQVVVPTMPTSYLIGRDGRVRSMHDGFHGDAPPSANCGGNRSAPG